ncbi:hypothetical protein BGHDH14_bgh02123 [Blumeria hordei DH14]|uniref:Uncharacterized protein n=1 Tax=Blumeria graminis f. sp. hordei (strain DH14) TaxID=546991 RepID=N1JPA8_BLUG1|nr:hypothetical protein BGHDH14_bgh02123 [Blumeria hordei DH14]
MTIVSNILRASSTNSMGSYGIDICRDEGQNTGCSRLSDLLGMSKVRKSSDDSLPAPQDTQYSVGEKKAITLCTEATYSIFGIPEQEQIDGQDVINYLTTLTTSEFSDDTITRPEESCARSLRVKPFPLSIASKDNGTLKSQTGLQRNEHLRLVPEFENLMAHLYQWADVRQDYIDQVWGDAVPLESFTRSTGEQSQSVNPKAYNSKAIRRLDAILDHIQADF